MKCSFKVTRAFLVTTTLYLLVGCSGGGVEVSPPPPDKSVSQVSKDKKAELPPPPPAAPQVYYQCRTNNTIVSSETDCPLLSQSTSFVPPLKAAPSPSVGPGPHPLYRFCWSKNGNLLDDEPCPDEIKALSKIFIPKEDREKYNELLKNPEGVPESVFVRPIHLKTKGLLACDLLIYTSTRDEWSSRYEQLCNAYPPKQAHGQSGLKYNILLRNDTVRLCDMAMPGTIAEIALRIKKNHTDYRIQQPLAECLELRVLDEKGMRKDNLSAISK